MNQILRSQPQHLLRYTELGFFELAGCSRGVDVSCREMERAGGTT